MKSTTQKYNGLDLLRDTTRGFPRIGGGRAEIWKMSSREVFQGRSNSIYKALYKEEACQIPKKKMQVYTVAEPQGVRESLRNFESGETGKGPMMQGLEINVYEM